MPYYGYRRGCCVTGGYDTTLELDVWNEIVLRKSHIGLDDIQYYPSPLKIDPNIYPNKWVTNVVQYWDRPDNLRDYYEGLKLLRGNLALKDAIERQDYFELSVAMEIISDRFLSTIK